MSRRLELPITIGDHCGILENLVNGMNGSADSETAGRITAILAELGVAESYQASCGLAMQPECRTLVDTEPDVFGRQPRLDVKAFAAWTAMRDAAANAGIVLQIISAFRSIDYQRDLILRKLNSGRSLEEILRVNAAPGFSEHHSGRAVDVGTTGFPHLEIAFEESPAFAWLGKNAADFGFYLSFPLNNEHGVQYEPWHWCYNDSAEQRRI